MTKPKIYHIIPWNSDKNLGKSYNETMSLVGDEDWICFLDGDAVHTTTYFGSRIEEVVSNNPDYFLFTCHTNRIGNGYQIPQGVNRATNDYGYHRSIGENLWQTNGTNVVDITQYNLLSGVLILLRKSEWEKVGGFDERKMLGIDNSIHKKFQKNNLKVGLMTGIYVQHWYRGGTDNRSHLI